MLESQLHEDNAFVTLTYDDDHLPKGGSLDPKELQDWLKRFRSSISPLRIRFYACGEYGDQTHRPHYHLAIFGYPRCFNGMSLYSDRPKRLNCCASCDLVRDTWGRGRIFVGSLETHSAQYIAGYVTKKMTSRDDPRLFGRHPEFSRKSNRPGIGADFMHEVASTLMKLNLDTSQPDVPSELRHGAKKLPLGRYLRRKLRTYVGKDEKTPQSVFDEASQELLEMRLAARSSSEIPSLSAQIALANKGAAASIESRYRIYKKKGSV